MYIITYIYADDSSKFNFWI